MYRLHLAMFAAPAENKRRLSLRKLPDNAEEVVPETRLEEVVFVRHVVASDKCLQLARPVLLAEHVQPGRRHVQPRRNVSHVGDRGRDCHKPRLGNGELRPQAVDSGAFNYLER